MLGFLLLSGFLWQGEAAASRPAEPSLLEQLDREYRALSDRLRKAYVSITAERGAQEVVFSGTLLDGEGRIAVPTSGLTDSARLFARCDGRTFYAVRLFDDPSSPLSIIQLVFNTKDPAPAAPAFALPGGLSVGDTIGVVSNAFDFEGSVLFGSVSGTDRVAALLPKLRLFQTTVGAVRGTPGGVVGNRRGEVVGVLLGGTELNGSPLAQVQLMQVTPFPGQEASPEDPQRALGARTFTRIEARIGREPGVSLILPIERIHALLSSPELLLRPKACAPAARPGELPLIGVFLKETADEATRARLGMEPNLGLVVDEVVEASPAKAAGLKKFDVLLRADGQSLDGTEQFRRCLLSAADKGSISIDLQRGGSRASARIEWKN
jgi:S1-C subfamily serine protease